MENFDDPETLQDEAFLPLHQGGKRSTVLIAAFEGWNDAGEAASDTIKFLSKAWHARKVSVLEPDDYYDFQFTRPTVRTTGSGERRLRWPGARSLRRSWPRPRNSGWTGWSCWARSWRMSPTPGPSPSP